MTDKVRLSLDVSEDINILLEELQKKMGVTSKSEVLRRAIALVDVAVNANEEGKKLVIANANEKINAATEIVGLVSMSRGRK